MLMKNKFVLLFAAMVSVSAPAQTWNFSTDAQGWQIVDRVGSRATGYVTGGDQIYPADWSATGGQSAGYISHVDPSANTFFFMSPQNLGDYSTYVGGTLNFSLNCDSPITWNQDNYLVLRSGGVSLFAQFVSPVQNTWSTYSVNLIPASFSDINNNPVNTVQLAAVLGNLTSLEISAEFTASPPWEITGLDSVSFQAVPEPAAASLLLAAACLGLGIRRRR